MEDEIIFFFILVLVPVPVYVLQSSRLCTGIRSYVGASSSCLSSCDFYRYYLGSITVLQLYNT